MYKGSVSIYKDSGRMYKYFFLLLSMVTGLVSYAQIRLPSVISSNMVLQQKSKVRLWGWCEPGETVNITTSWNNRVDSVKGNRDAQWQISIPTPEAGGPYTITLKGYSTIMLENVLIGEVWICSGQSNMEMNETWGLPDVREALPGCATNNIHFFQIPRTTSDFPQGDCKASWVVCDSVALKKFSAVGYFFGKKLNKELNVPIGLIQAAWGGTAAEVWTPADLVNGDALLKNAADKQVPTDWWPYKPGSAYNGMIAPVTSYSIAGAIWYQGESNTVVPQAYGKLFTTMIGAWRKAWNKDLPFYYVQIAPYAYETWKTAGLLREQQAVSMKLEHTGMVVISDITGDTSDIHPKNKHDVGLRLANWALAETYHLAAGTDPKDATAYKSPAYKMMEINGDKIKLGFENAGNGLMVKGPVIKEVYMAGADRVFYPAQGRIEGGLLVVTSPLVKKPVAVRYQFGNAAIGNVFSKEGLPLAPFRTDDWTVK
ncbi:sialate O-acetylesterase [Flavitalea flava]